MDAAMTRDAATELAGSRCDRCGTVFACRPAGDCWCMLEPVGLPLPPAGSGARCLCPDCLRLAAADHAAAIAMPTDGLPG
jgi:hypothetical protein